MYFSAVLLLIGLPHLSHKLSFSISGTTRSSQAESIQIHFISSTPVQGLASHTKISTMKLYQGFEPTASSTTPAFSLPYPAPFFCPGLHPSNHAETWFFFDFQLFSHDSSYPTSFSFLMVSFLYLFTYIQLFILFSPQKFPQKSAGASSTSHKSQWFVKIQYKLTSLFAAGLK